MAANVSQAGYEFVESIVNDSIALLANINAQIAALEANKTEVENKITDAEAVLADLNVV